MTLNDENKYLKTLKFNLLKCIHTSRTDKVIEETLQENNFQLLVSYQTLLTSKETFVDRTMQPEEDSFLDFLSLPTSTRNFDKTFCLTSNFPVDTSKTMLIFEFLCLSAEKQYQVYLSRHYEYLCKDLTNDCFQYANTGKRNDITLITMYLDHLNRFITLNYDPVPLRFTFLHNFDIFCKFFVSYCDDIRNKALRFFFSVCNIQEKVNLFPLYLEMYDFENWYNQIKDYTFESRFLPISRKEANAILTLNTISRFGSNCKSLSREESRILEDFKERIQVIMDDFKCPVFVKLSSRSPKDSGFTHPKYEEMMVEMRNDWRKKYKYGIDLPKSIENSISQICCAMCLQVKTSSEEAIQLLLRSERTLFDFQLTIDQYSQEFSLELIIRKWTELSLHTEVRTFVRDGKMNAATQYFSFCYFPWMNSDKWMDLIKRIREMFLKIVDLIPYKDCVIDFVESQGKIMIIEINPFGNTAGSCLFSWEKDQDVMYNGPFEFRYIGDENLVVNEYIIEN